MKAVKVTLPRSLKNIKIYTFADWHIGDRSCDIDTIKETILSVKNDKESYVICNGDVMNNATRTSVSDCYAEALTPMEQLQTICELLEPIKDKILLVTQGNHESRTYRTDGVDLTALWTKQLGIYDRYVREGGVLFLRLGQYAHGRKQHNDFGLTRQVCYTIYCTHGSGGGKREGGKANILADMASIVDCDIYIHSHTHLPMIMKQNFFRVDTCNSYIAETEKLFVNTAAQLKYGGYGQALEFKPSNTTTPTVCLSGTKKHSFAIL
jgi:predicted phosphodiesterase